MKKSKKYFGGVVCILLCMVLMLGIAPITAKAASGYSGTPKNPARITSSNYQTLGLTDENWGRYNGWYAIRTAEELYGYANLVNSGSNTTSAVLLQDITVNTGTVTENGSSTGITYEWKPIGTESMPYLGTFDGNGCTISGIYINSTGNEIGLFGCVGKVFDATAGVVTNVILANSYIRGDSEVGGITGILSGDHSKISHCVVASDVTVVAVNKDSAYVGGICGGFGQANSFSSGICSVSDCVTLGIVNAPNTKNDAGAVIGHYRVVSNAAEFIGVSNCYFIDGNTLWLGEVHNIGKGGTPGLTSTTEGCIMLTSPDADHTCISVAHRELKATCLYPGASAYSQCGICGKVTEGTKTLEAVKPDEHESSNLYNESIDNAVHGIYHECCKGLKETVKHTFEKEATCTTAVNCIDCGGSSGLAKENHTGKFTYTSVDGEQHKITYSCCGAFVKNEVHNYQGGNCITEEKCTFCKQTGSRLPQLHAYQENVAKVLEDTTKHAYYKKCCGEPIENSSEEHIYVDGACSVCSYECLHETLEEGVCVICKESGTAYLFKEWNGTEVVTTKRYTAGMPTVVTSGTTHMSDGWYVVIGDVTVNGTIEIKGDVHLILADGAHLNAKMGITKANLISQTLSIYAQSENSETTGKLTATGGVGKAGIGGVGFKLVIHGGVINAKGGDSGGVGENAKSGIGGSTASVTIHGGIVTATGGWDAAGIGSGYGDNYCSVTINGGVITATGTGYGAGIGSGEGGNSGAIIIRGGFITANGNKYGSSIGGGAQDYENIGGSARVITITGGTIIAPHGIGGGRLYAGSASDRCSTAGITITGGNINGTMYKTPVDGNGNEVQKKTFTVFGSTNKMPITALTGMEGYGMNDVCTLDTNKLYVWCASDSEASDIVAGEEIYDCKTGLVYAQHAYQIATCTEAEHCIYCGLTNGSVPGHRMTDGICTGCGLREEEDVYYISMPEQLIGFAACVNSGDTDAHGILQADIDMNGYLWTSICETGLYYKEYGEDLGFAGVFDGNKHVIKNLTVASSATEDASCGLFGTVSGTVKNLGMENFTFVDGGMDIRAGAVAGQLITKNGLIENCYVLNAAITPGAHVIGGIAGCVYDGTIQNCYVYDSTLSATDKRFGYIVGDSRGDGGASDRPGKVKNSYADKTPIYSNNTGSIEGCAQMSSEEYAKGKVAYLLNGGVNDGTQVWYQNIDNGMPTDVFPVFDSSHGTIYEVTCVENTIYRNANRSYEAHDYVENYCSRCGEVDLQKDEQGTFLIYTAKDLGIFRDYVNTVDASANAKLMADIDLAEITWSPIGVHSDSDNSQNVAYSGTFDGNYHVIRNLSVKVETTHETGLFGRISGGTVKNLGVVNATIENTQKVRAGVIAGEIHNATVINVFTAGTIAVNTEHNQAGGIAGECANSTLVNCYTTYEMLTANATTVTNCYYQADAVNSSSKGTNQPAEAYESGALAYLLNDGMNDGIWKQTIGEDAYPSFEGPSVYAYAATCDTTVPEGYTNDKGQTVSHAYGEDGICTVCKTFQSAEQVDGIYEIYNVGQYLWFADFVNTLNPGADAKLMADIDLTDYYAAYGNVMIGTSSMKYKGSFDGNGKTLTVKFESAENYTAPFRYIQGAYIHDLTVEGSITTSKQFAGGLVANSAGASKVERCISRVVIDSSVSGDGTHGGLVAHVFGGSLSIEQCAFTGAMNGSNTTNSAGMTGWCAGPVTIKNSYVAGTFTMNSSGSDTFGRRNAEANLTLENCYYLEAFGGTNGGPIAKDDTAFASGEVCWLLNGSAAVSDGWRQNLEEDAYPGFKGMVVFYNEEDGYENDHIHHWKYLADAQSIQVICEEADCTETNGGKVTILEPVNLIYDETSKDAELLFENWQPEEEIKPVISYNEVDRINVTGENIVASITLGDETVYVTYQVSAIALDGAVITAEDQQYTGSPLTPEVSVVLNDVTLVQGTHYTVTYENHTEAGQATIIVKGVGNYAGTVTGTFEILRAPEVTVTPTVTPMITEEPEVTVTPGVTEEPEVTVTPGVTEVPGQSVTEIFDDVYNDWYTGYVQYVYDNNLMTGIKGTRNFAPNANVTKAQVAQVLYNMEDQPEVADKKVFTELKDVYAGEWYANAVAWAYNTGVVTGDLNTKKFSPNADVTREQLALMMFRYAQFKQYDTSATTDYAGLVNADKVNNWAADGMKWAVGEGLISGVEKDGVKDLAPQGVASRAQMAAILQRFCETY